MKTRIRTFRDQEGARALLMSEVAEEVADLMFAMDVVTLDGVEDAPAAEREAYDQFRSWFAPRLMQGFLALFGRLLCSVVTDERGAVDFDLESLDLARDIGSRAGVASRLTWLIGEIPSLIEGYGQLYPDESVKALELCAEADALDLGDEAGWRRGQEVLIELEEHYKWAQPNARVARCDPDAVEEFRVGLLALSQALDDAEARRAITADVISSGHGSPEELQAAIDRLEKESDIREAQMRKLDRERKRLESEQSAASAKLTELLMAAG